MPPNTTELYKPILGELKPATFSLGVPLEDDVVQVGIYIHAGTLMGRLAVTIEEDLIRLRREDGQKLQVDNNEQPFGTPEQRGRVRLLARPVSELVLRSSAAPEGVWQAEGEDLKITDTERFDRFLTQIFLHAFRKQNPDATIAEVMEILDRHQEF